jgi:outer membrane lipoprotein-sorting protein
MSRKKNLLHDLYELAGLNPDAIAAERALECAKSSLESPLHLSLRAKLMRPRNLAAIAAAIAIIVVLSQLLPTGGGNFAFGQVKEQVAKTKSVQYTEIRTNLSKDGKAESESETKIMISGPSMERREISPTQTKGKLPEGTILLGAPDRYISIYDATTGKMITLFPEKKGYVLPRDVMSINDDGSVKTSTIKAAPKADFYARIQEIPADPTKRLPEQTIEGKTAVGFVYESKRELQSGEDTWTRTVWIDPKTKLPVRIDVAYRSTNPTHGESDWVLKDFIFDAPLDQKLFSCDPPAGYIDLAKVAVNGPQRVEGKRTEFVFAEVKEEVASTKSVQYDESISTVLGDGTMLQSEKRVSILGNHLKHEEQTLKVIGKDGKEIPERTQRSIEVFDAQSEKLLVMLPEKKEYFTKDFSQPAKGDSFKPAITATMFLKGGFYDLIRDVPVEKAKPLPEKQIAGKAAVGFLVEEKVQAPEGANVWQRTYWIDPETKLPLQIEVKLRTDVAAKAADDAANLPADASTGGSMNDTIRNIVFDAVLDPRIFSLDPPAGYTNPAAKESADRAKPDAK